MATSCLSLPKSLTVGAETSAGDSDMERVRGIGGYFVRAADPVALGAWYRDCLGLDADENGLWRQEAGPTVFATFESETGSSCGSPPDRVFSQAVTSPTYGLRGLG
jgi:hypothetical protein